MVRFSLASLPLNTESFLPLPCLYFAPNKTEAIVNNAPINTAIEAESMLKSVRSDQI